MSSSAVFLVLTVVFGATFGLILPINDAINGKFTKRAVIPSMSPDTIVDSALSVNLVKRDAILPNSNMNPIESTENELGGILNKRCVCPLKGAAGLGKMGSKGCHCGLKEGCSGGMESELHHKSSSKSSFSHERNQSGCRCGGSEFDGEEKNGAMMGGVRSKLSSASSLSMEGSNRISQSGGNLRSISSSNSGGQITKMMGIRENSDSEIEEDDVEMMSGVQRKSSSASSYNMGRNQINKSGCNSRSGSSSISGGGMKMSREQSQSYSRGSSGSLSGSGGYLSGDSMSDVEEEDGTMMTQVQQKSSSASSCNMGSSNQVGRSGSSMRGMSSSSGQMKNSMGYQSNSQRSISNEEEFSKMNAKDQMSSMSSQGSNRKMSQSKSMKKSESKRVERKLDYSQGENSEYDENESGCSCR